METTEELNNIGGLYSKNFSMIFDSCPDGIVFKDEDLCYIGANKSYCLKFCSDDFGSLAGKVSNEQIPAEKFKLIHDADCEVREERTPVNYIIDVGKGRILNITTSPIVFGEKFCGAVSIVRDITQEETIKEKFVDRHFKYVNNSKRLQEQREMFVASIGHDLKNPTIAQIRSLELLLGGNFGELKPEQREILEMILDSCRYMYGMLSSLLATYRNYEGAERLNFEEFNFVTLLSECVSEMLYVAKEKGIRISTDIDAPEIIIYADRVQIKRVIMNLLSNGIKYAFRDTELKLSVGIKGELLDFWFENESPFIPKDKQKEIFSRYVSYAGMYNELGNGLGLYASSRIIKSHGGKMYMKSFDYNQNIFGFMIPIRQETEAEVMINF